MPKNSEYVELSTSPSSATTRGSGGSEPGQRLAVGLARRDLRADLVARLLRAARLERVRGALGRRRHVDPDVAHAAELLQRLLRVLGRHRLPVPAGLILDLRVALALQRSRDHRRRLAGRLLRLLVGAVDLVHVVPVDRDRVPAEGAEPLGVRVELPAVPRLAALAQPVDVDDRRQVVELLERRGVERLPHRAFGQLAVAADHPGAEGQPVELLAGEREADADRKALTERAGRDVHPRQHGRRVTLQPRAELAVGHELLFRDRTGRAEEAVDERGRMTLREDQAVVGGALRLLVVVAEVPCEEDGCEIGRRHRRGRMARARLGARPHRVDSQLLSQLSPELALVHGGLLARRLS